jgi:anti-anti-sigma factor
MTRPTHASVVERFDGPEAAQLKSSTRTGVLRVRIANDRRHSTLVLEGEVDLSNAGVLEQAIRHVEVSASESITIDLSRMHFIDLRGVRAIVDAVARLDGRLRLIKGPPWVQSVFHLTGAEAALPFET